MKSKISQKTGVIVVLAVFLILLSVGLYLNYKHTQKKGKGELFNFDVPQKK